MKKPNLENVKVIKKSIIPEILKKSLTPAVLAHLEEEGAKETETDNMVVGEWFVIERYLPGGYHKFATDGLRSELSVFRMAGGCNNLHAFLDPSAEKSEDYDSLSDEALLYQSDGFGEAAEIIEDKYIGKKLRVVARSAHGMDQYGHRYYLFAL